jgi:hypothetical protein
MSIQEIVTNIDARIAELESEIQPLLEARLALLNSSQTPTPATRRQTSTPKPATTPAAKSAPPAETPKPALKRRPRRAARRVKVDPVPSGKLISLLGSSDGMTATALAKEAGGNANQVRVLLQELAQAGDVRRTGERRGTRWHLITDEEKIAARAGEIEAQMKAPPANRARRARSRTARPS